MPIKDTLRALGARSDFKELLQLVDQGDSSAVLKGLAGASSAMVFAQLAYKSSRRLLVLVDDMKRARKMVSDLALFLNICRDKYTDYEGILLPADAARADRRDDIIVLPSRSTLPFEMFSPPHSESAERHLALQSVRSGAAKIVVSPVESFLVKTAPQELVNRFTLRLSAFDTFDLEAAATMLLSAGYTREYQAELPSSFAVRGGILDVFPPNAELGYRIEFMDDQVESIREYDPGTQRSVSPLESVVIPPASEVILTEDVTKKAVKNILSIKPSPDQYINYQNVIERLEQLSHFAGMENYLSLIYDDPKAPLELFDDGFLLVVATSSAPAELVERFQAKVDEARIAAERTSLFFSDKMLKNFVDESEFLASFDGRQKVFLQDDAEVAASTPKVALSESCKRFDFDTSPVCPVGNDVVLMLLSLFRRKNSADDAVHIVCHTPAQARKMRKLLLSDELGIANPMEMAINADVELGDEAFGACWPTICRVRIPSP